MTTKLCDERHWTEQNNCGYWLEYCNLCHQLTYCEKHGCSNCNLKPKDNSRELLYTPEEERAMLIAVTQREVSLRATSSTRKRKTYANRKPADSWLDDFLAIQ